MAKLHGRVKRKWPQTKSLNNVPGTRTFGTKDAALAYAQEHKMKGTLVSVKKGKRWAISSE